MKDSGDPCECCKKERLVLVRGALVCPACDVLAYLPKATGLP